MTQANFNKNNAAKWLLEFKAKLPEDFSEFPKLKGYLEGTIPTDIDERAANEWREKILDFVNFQLELAHSSKYEEEGLFVLNRLLMGS